MPTWTGVVLTGGPKGGAEGSPHSLFLQEAHVQPSHLQESEQVQEPPRGGGATGRVNGVEFGVGPGLKGDGVPSLNAL